MRLGKEVVKEEYGNLFDMYEKITGENPYEVPMRIYPAVHYTMGGLWVDYELMTSITGLYCLGEANFSDHGANRLGASALMQGLADGYFVIPYTIGNYLADEIRTPSIPVTHPAFEQTEIAVRERIETLKFAALLRGAAVISVLTQNITPPANQQELDRVFAKVNSHNITSRDIEQSLAPLIYRVQQEVYEARKVDLDLKINDMLLEDEAKRQNTTPEAILQREVRGKMPVISDEQAKAFYNENKAQISKEFPEVKMQILQYLMDREQKRLTDALAAELRKNAAVQVYLLPPDQPKSTRAG